jgi:hypothetical protein
LILIGISGVFRCVFQVVVDVVLVLLVDLLLSPLYATLIHELILLATKQAGWALGVPTVMIVPLCIRSLRSDVLITNTVAEKTPE